MDIEINKNEEGQHLCEMMSGWAKGTTLDIDNLLYYLGDSFGGNQISRDVTGIAMRYAIALLSEKDIDERTRVQALDDLLTLELLTTAFSESINSPDTKPHDYIKLKAEYDQQIANIRQQFETIIAAKEENIKGQEDLIKMMELHHAEKDDLIKNQKELIGELRSEIAELRKE